MPERMTAEPGAGRPVQQRWRAWMAEVAKDGYELAAGIAGATVPSPSAPNESPAARRNAVARRHRSPQRLLRDKARAPMNAALNLQRNVLPLRKTTVAAYLFGAAVR